MADDEEPLRDGSAAVRIGDTVRRPRQPWSASVAALLRHLQEVGFDGAPVWLGADERGREVVGYLPSERTWPFSETVLMDIARLTRRLHDALEGFVPPPDAVWALHRPAGPGYRFGHNDIHPANTVFAGGVPYAFIDWELAGPAPALHDVVWAAVNFVPLRPDHFCRAMGFSELPERAARLRRFCDAYGLSDRSSFVAVVEEYMRNALQEIVELGGAGVQPFSRFLANGEDRYLRCDLAWVMAQRDELGCALE